ncbi:hypothetical protein LRP31_25465 [Mesorhizobium mediterraneum]|uniref:Uncharacterized protein n=1 Tax=Mesorhizobium mediterraneum TaxID=43617 RepID=A0AB36R817_9HYPH|nr:hypothetical protein [Mesorhizobium mediterraneum]PAQ00908.1 hypothetical protein CIT25_17735 [Mesorhizobium mediterraneum]WIW52371.1 hypothetical protein LRP31_25465 [Mesorhizobium mediterraneum]
MTIALLSKHMKLAEHVRQVWHVTPRPEDGADCITDPLWWVHVSRLLKPGDKIEVLSENREWYAEGIVLDAGIWGAKVALTHGPMTLANEAKVEPADEYEIKWAGPSAKFRVIRKKDNRVLKEECQSKEEAAAWVKSHRNAMAA